MTHTERIESEKLKKMRMRSPRGFILKVDIQMLSPMVMAISINAKGPKGKGHLKLLIKGLQEIGCLLLRPKVMVLSLVVLLFLSVLSMGGIIVVID